MQALEPPAPLVAQAHQRWDGHQAILEIFLAREAARAARLAALRR